MQAQEVTSQGSFYSVNDPRLHFGLGPAAVADLEIRWPSGQIQRLAQVKAGRILEVKEP